MTGMGTYIRSSERNCALPSGRRTAAVGRGIAAAFKFNILPLAILSPVV